jgi:hypothetical protein
MLINLARHFVSPLYRGRDGSNTNALPGLRIAQIQNLLLLYMEIDVTRNEVISGKQVKTQEYKIDNII